MNALSRMFAPAACAAVLGACANGSPISIGTGLAGSAGATEAGASGNGGGAGMDASIIDSSTEDAPSPVCFPCSADLHSVIDCPSGKVLQTCPGDQGCANGKCVPACDSATVNKSSFGCDFYSVQPEATSFYWYCFAAFVVNTWTTPIDIGVELAGKQLDIAPFARIPHGTGAHVTYGPLPGGKLPPGEVAILFLSNDTPDAGKCPDGVTTPRIGNADQTLRGTAIGTTFHITTSAPVSAYDMYPFGGGAAAVTSATLLLPTSAWGTNYVAVSPWAPSNLTGYSPAIQLVAAEDATHVTIRPTFAIPGGTNVEAAAAGAPHTYTLDRGQVLELSPAGRSLEGSPIESDKPIGMWASQSCFNVPESTPYCDSAHQQIPHVGALGSEYVGVRYRNRLDNGIEETPPWRITALVDGTVLDWKPSPPANAPTALHAGEIATFEAAGPFAVKSQDDKHPFYLAQYMSSCGAVGDIHGVYPGCPGDPEFVNVVPPLQFLDHYVFFTDPTYPDTNLVLVKKGDADVTLDCLAAPIDGWQPIGSSGFKYARLDLVRGNFEPQGGCDNGRHEIKSQAPFGVTVWGWGSLDTGTGEPDAGILTQGVSYAYPAGMSLQPINTVHIIPK